MTCDHNQPDQAEIRQEDLSTTESRPYYLYVQTDPNTGILAENCLRAKALVSRLERQVMILDISDIPMKNRPVWMDSAPLLVQLDRSGGFLLRGEQVCRRLEQLASEPAVGFDDGDAAMIIEKVTESDKSEVDDPTTNEKEPLGEEETLSPESHETRNDGIPRAGRGHLLLLVTVALVCVFAYNLLLLHHLDRVESELLTVKTRLEKSELVAARVAYGRELTLVRMELEDELMDARARLFILETRVKEDVEDALRAVRDRLLVLEGSDLSLQVAKVDAVLNYVVEELSTSQTIYDCGGAGSVGEGTCNGLTTSPECDYKRAEGGRSPWYHHWCTPVGKVVPLPKA